MIDRLRSAGSQAQEVSKVNIRRQTPTVPSLVLQTQDIHPLPGRLRASILLPLAHRPISISRPPDPPINTSISHPPDIRATTNISLLALLIRTSGHHLLVLLPNKGIRDRVPSTRTMAVILAQTLSDRLPALLLRVHPRFREIVLRTLPTTLQAVSLPNMGETMRSMIFNTGVA